MKKVLFSLFVNLFLNSCDIDEKSKIIKERQKHIGNELLISGKRYKIIGYDQMYDCYIIENNQLISASLVSK